MMNGQNTSCNLAENKSILQVRQVKPAIQEVEKPPISPKPEIVKLSPTSAESFKKISSATIRNDHINKNDRASSERLLRKSKPAVVKLKPTAAEVPKKSSPTTITNDHVNKNDKTSSFTSLSTFQPTASPKNPNFFFHNKMPRCGSTTMRNILSALSQRNNFNFIMIPVANPIGYNDESLVNYVAGKRSQEPGTTDFVIKHHTFVNFTDYGHEQPTYINVIRNPIDRYISNYYTCRYGMEGQNGLVGPRCRNMTQEQLDEPVEQYFLNLKRRYELSKKSLTIRTNYCHWICGGHKVCALENSLKFKHKAYEYAKNLVLNEFFVIGMLERFDDTLALFEKLMPTVYAGALTLSRESELVSKVIEGSAAKVKPSGLTNSTRQWLEATLFSYDIDLYRFVEKKFDLQFKKFVVG